MTALSPLPAATIQLAPNGLMLAGAWTALGSGGLERQLTTLALPAGRIEIDAASLTAFDSVGAWLLARQLGIWRTAGHAVEMCNLRPEFARLLDSISASVESPPPATGARDSRLAAIGRPLVATFEEACALLAFIGETALCLAGSLARPSRLRWRPVLYNIRSAGLDALPIVGLLSFLLGIVIAYQGADQLRQYGANTFVADLVGLSMLREFAPLITAIIVAGRSGSAYAAQIGSMSVSEEIDAMRTLGMAPQEVLVLPKLLALLVALPLLTVFADLLGVFGGMLMAKSLLAVSFDDFAERFTKAVSVTAYLVGIGKAPVFAGIIVIVGCFQGFRTQGGADGVGRQTTRSVVQSIFLVIVADALFSVAFSMLDL